MTQTSATPDTSAAVCKMPPEVQISNTKVKSGRMAAFEAHFAGLINYYLTIFVHIITHKMYIISCHWSPQGLGLLSARCGCTPKGHSHLEMSPPQHAEGRGRIRVLAQRHGRVGGGKEGSLPCHSPATSSTATAELQSPAA